VEQVIVKEKITGILLGFGGQTALNCGLALASNGALARHGVRVMGTPIEAILATEDRQIFVNRLAKIDVKTARSQACTTPDEALVAARTIGYPVILRGAFSLGGKGSAIVHDESAAKKAVARAFAGVPQVLVEECLAGWKEIEYEVVRDAKDNCITVCNMENVDPMGIHTGESIVVAPTQTLDDHEVQMLRDIAIRTIRDLGIVGECNIQFALDPLSTDYRVIEVNARLSRSSALASKATGYPLATIAAKLSLGYTLPELSNAITRSTTAFFEPALDYIVCKVPRWDLEKFAGVGTRIGSEMKSVGEVMGIGRSFPEALQKALRMLDNGADGLDPDRYEFDDLRQELANPSPRRIFAVAQAFEQGMTLDDIARLTAIDRFFLAEIEGVIELGRRLSTLRENTLNRATLRAAKRDGFSDKGIARRVGTNAESIRQLRLKMDVRPRLAQIDTLAAEYPAHTNYLYMTYAADVSDVPPSPNKQVLVLGSGCYRIGSSVEFDWCCVSAVKAARELGYETILLNCNPETVSTDYDMCDRLLFDEISLETILELCDQEQPMGVLLSMGGQTPNNLALKLHKSGIKILGTSPESIDVAEDRGKFLALLDKLHIDQPRWTEAVDLTKIGEIVSALGGFPVLVRPSYVLSGAAMRVAHTEQELHNYLVRATSVSPEHPVVVSRFEQHAREIDIDAVASGGKLIRWAISEHIEDAGVHSGDATLVLPPQGLYIETLRQARRITQKLATALQVTGPFNIQMLARHNVVKVIECNLRTSRSFPFVSKVLGVNFVAEATRAMLNAPPLPQGNGRNPLELDYVAVKAPQFSFGRLTGADPRLGVEMASTGEVACFGDDRHEALLKALLATGFRYPRRGVLLSLGPMEDKYRFLDEARVLQGMGLALYGTPGTADILNAESIPCVKLAKAMEGDTLPAVITALEAGGIDLVINVPRDWDADGRPDGYRIRRRAIDLEIPLITDLWLARRIVQAMSHYRLEDLQVKSWQTYLASEESSAQAY
jgi:carbamoyl-phosphate synthase large subunit